MKKIFVILAVMIGLTLFAIYLKTQSTSFNDQLGTQKIPVVASFYPLAFFAEQIGGEKTTVTNITPSGAEPHDYEPTTADLTSIAKSSLLISIGPVFESWQGKVVANNVLQIASALPIENNDPHVWLSPVLAKQIVIKMTEALTEISPENAAYFETNKITLLSKLSKLDESFKEGLSRCTKHDIVTSHSAFGYLARQYGFTQIAIAGLSPDEEPTPQKLTEITNLVRTKNISYIFFESLVSPRLAQTIANETQAKTLVFNPLEGLTSDEVQNGADYFTVQTENLKNLRQALSCM